MTKRELIISGVFGLFVFGSLWAGGLGFQNSFLAGLIAVMLAIFFMRYIEAQNSPENIRRREIRQQAYEEETGRIIAHQEARRRAERERTRPKSLAQIAGIGQYYKKPRL